MRDVLLEGLPVIDFLEISPSTIDVAELIGCDQSSVSRIYRFVSEKLELEFVKSEEGFYSSNANHELLADLRRASQRLRFLNGKSLRLTGQYWNEELLQGVPVLGPLSRGWFGLKRSLELLRNRVVDFVVVNTMDLGINGLLLRQGARPRWIHRDLAGFTLCSYAIKPLVHESHPLFSKQALDHNHLWGYPSPAFVDDDFPHLSAALKERGLWQDQVVAPYRWKRWEGKCRDRKTIAYHTPIIERFLSDRIALKPLPMDLGLHDLEAVICLEDMAKHPIVEQVVGAIQKRYREALGDTPELVMY